MSFRSSEFCRNFVRIHSTGEMKRSRKILSLILVTFLSGISGNEGEVEPFYNEDCPVPDLADLCQNSCSQELTNCLIGCGIDEGTGLLKKLFS